MQSKEENPKFGDGHASAMARLGLRELRSAFYPQSNVAQQSEYGLYGTSTPQEITEAKRDDGGRNIEEEKGSVLADRLRQAEARDDRGRDSKSMEKE